MTGSDSSVSSRLLPCSTRLKVSFKFGLKFDSFKMSFENYQNFPSQQGGQDGGAGGPPPPQDQQMVGQMGDNGGQYPGGNGGQPGSAGGQSQGGDEKTTLWYDISSTSA